MNIPIHLNFLSIPIILMGILIIFKFKAIAAFIYKTYSRKFETFMEGEFKDNFVNGYGKFISIVAPFIVGVVIILFGLSLSFGPITSG